MPVMQHTIIVKRYENGEEAYNAKVCEIKVDADGWPLAVEQARAVVSGRKIEDEMNGRTETNSYDRDVSLGRTYKAFSVKTEEIELFE